MNLFVFARTLTAGIAKTHKHTGRYRLLIGLLGIVFFSFGFTVRLLPIPFSDRSVFISVAEYLRSGSRLYVDVYDNKDPLFFYAVAIQRLLGPLGEYLFELLMVAIAAFSACDIAGTVNNNGMIRPKALLIAVPLLVTGMFWLPGMTHLPAIALGLLTISFFLRKKSFSAGVCLGLVAFVKLIMLPLPVVFCLAYEWVMWGKASFQRCRRVTAGFMAVVGLMTILLLARHELVGYLQAQRNNFFYAQGVLVDNSSFFNAFASHLRTMFFGSYEQLVLLGSFVAGMVVCVAGAVGPGVEKARRAFWVGTGWLGAISLIVLGLTGLWDHHLQLFYFVQTLVLVGVASCSYPKKTFTHAFFGRSTSGIVVVALALLLSGTLSWQHYAVFVKEASSTVSYVMQASPETTAFRSLHPSGTAFARLGLHTGVIPYGAADDGLVCPDFAQYPFYSAEKLEGVLDCAQAAPTLVVMPSFVPLAAAPDWWPRESQKQIMLDNWNAFVAAGERVIEAKYACQQIDYIRICEMVSR